MESVRGPEYALLIELLKEERKRTGLTQKEICDKLGKPKNYLIKVENGDRRLDVVELFSLCRALGQDPVDLITRYAKQLDQLQKTKPRSE